MNRSFSLPGTLRSAFPRPRLLATAAAGIGLFPTLRWLRADETAADKDKGWRALPLIADGKIDPNWVHVGYGGFVVEDGALRTEPAANGLGLLVFKKERFGG